MKDFASVFSFVRAIVLIIVALLAAAQAPGPAADCRQ